MEEDVLDTSTVLLSGQVVEEEPLEAEFLLPEDLIDLREARLNECRLVSHVRQPVPLVHQIIE